MSYGAKYIAVTLMCISVCFCAFVGAYTVFNRRQDDGGVVRVNEANTRQNAGIDAEAGNAPPDKSAPVENAPDEQMREVISAGDKINENTKIVYEYYYVSEDKLEKMEQYAPQALLNLTREQLVARIEGFSVESFSSDTVVLRKNINSRTAKRYIIGEWEGKVAVFYGSPDNAGIKEITDTPVSSLPQSERERLKEGIVVESDKELMRVLEDYGS